MARLQRLRGLHKASDDNFHLYPRSYEVTKVSMLLKIFNKKSKVARLHRLRGLHRASADDFHWHPQSNEVTKVLMLLKIFNKKQRLQISQLLKHFICHKSL